VRALSLSLSLYLSQSKAECSPQSLCSEQLCIKIRENLAPIVEGSLAAWLLEKKGVEARCERGDERKFRWKVEVSLQCLVMVRS